MDEPDSVPHGTRDGNWDGTWMGRGVGCMVISTPQPACVAPEAVCQGGGEMDGMG